MANPGAKAPTLLLDSSDVTLGGETNSDISGYHIPALDVPAERPDIHAILLPLRVIGGWCHSRAGRRLARFRSPTSDDFGR